MFHSIFSLSKSLSLSLSLTHTTQSLCPSLLRSLTPSKYKCIASPQCGTVPYIAVRKNGISLSESYLPDARVCPSVCLSLIQLWMSVMHKLFHRFSRNPLGEEWRWVLPQLGAMEILLITGQSLQSYKITRWK